MSNGIFSGVKSSERAKLLKKPWSLADVMRERKAAEKRKKIVERFKKQWNKRMN